MIFFLSLLDPAPVSNLTTTFNDSTNLLLMWTTPVGDLDALGVSVLVNGTSVREMTLPPVAMEVAVHDLTPGFTYEVEVTSRSGRLMSQPLRTRVTAGKVT